MHRRRFGTRGIRAGTKPAARQSMAAKDRVTERIKYHTELLRLIWISVLAVGGGAVGFLFGPPDPPRQAAGFVGLGIGMLLGILLAYLDRTAQADQDAARGIIAMDWLGFAMVVIFLV